MAFEIKITPCGDGSYKLELPEGLEYMLERKDREGMWHKYTNKQINKILNFFSPEGQKKIRERAKLDREEFENNRDS